MLLLRPPTSLNSFRYAAFVFRLFYYFSTFYVSKKGIFALFSLICSVEKKLAGEKKSHFFGR